IDELLAIPRREVRVVPTLTAVAAAGEPVELASGPAHVCARAGLSDQDALDAQLVDRALDGLLGDAVHARDRRDRRQALAWCPVTAADLGADLCRDLPMWVLGRSWIDGRRVSHGIARSVASVVSERSVLIRRVPVRSCPGASCALGGILARSYDAVRAF